MTNYYVLGPSMIPDVKMTRYHYELGFFLTFFSREQIEILYNRFHKNGFEKNLGIDHGSEIYTGAKLIDSFLINSENQATLPDEFKDLPVGTWMLKMEFTDKREYDRINELGLTGFSVSGSFQIKANGKTYTVNEDFKRMNKLSDLLPFDIHVFGGSTEGAGRNEHGDAHFQLKEKGSRKDLGKIYMPTKESWENATQKERIKMMRVDGRTQLKPKEKKMFVRWLEIDENQNLIKCHNQWNESNEGNNRTNPI